MCIVKITKKYGTPLHFKYLIKKIHPETKIKSFPRSDCFANKKNTVNALPRFLWVFLKNNCWYLWYTSLSLHLKLILLRMLIDGVINEFFEVFNFRVEKIMGFGYEYKFKSRTNSIFSAFKPYTCQCISSGVYFCYVIGAVA